MAHPGRCLRLGVTLATACAALADTPADQVQAIVDEVSAASYEAFLNPAPGTDVLYTRTGDNRGYTNYLPATDHDPARDHIDAILAGTMTGRYDAAGLDPFSFTVSGHTYGGCGNVVAILQGLDEANHGIYIVGAHYDSVGNPGADDNASGVAGVLEAARVLSRYSFHATLIFMAFDAEEVYSYGLDRNGLQYFRGSGSGHWVETMTTADPDDPDRIWRGDVRAMVNLDMIAYNPNGSNYKARIYTGGTSMPTTLPMQLASALATYAGFAAGNVVQSGFIQWSDHYSFWQGGGIEAALLIEYNWSTNPYYHKPTDTADTADYIDYAYATQMLRGVVGYLAQKADKAPDPPSYGDFDADDAVDAADLAVLRACLTGEAVFYDPQNLPAGCTLAPDSGSIIPADFDADGDVDLSDSGVFQRCFSEPAAMPDPQCAD